MPLSMVERTERILGTVRAFGSAPGGFKVHHLASRLPAPSTNAHAITVFWTRAARVRAPASTRNAREGLEAPVAASS